MIPMPYNKMSMFLLALFGRTVFAAGFRVASGAGRDAFSLEQKSLQESILHDMLVFVTLDHS